ncbi:Carbon catabolite repressor protein 4 like 1 [Apostasia shenzhenica]|uniref:Carbon catabolite repressor protein 4 like 1 n=1 Tax=Apostasia shenzhenica TaxID=1088818 RepID=A0A2H9ZQL9_9ASPA|nr:Carbon catabolite repressor protein 4 like 1 [Apostasia shenzhenica]
MLSVLRIHLVSEIPVVGCEITPYVVLRLPDGSISNEDVLESAPLGGHYMRYKWHRIQTNGKFAVCSIHPTERATLQCVVCLKARVPSAKTFHCSTRCFSDAWQHHLVMHDPATNSMIANGNEEEQSLGRFSSHISERSLGDTCFEVGRSRTYIPSADDIGHVLKFECVPVDAQTRLPVGNVSTITTSCVITAPSPSPRRMIRVSGADFQGNTDTDERTLKFRVLSYNILADHYAATDKYGYCPSWALSWSYRRQNLLKEIVGYNVDIICLQEVQSNHFKDFFAPELSKHGYDGLYKKKTTKIDNGNPDRIDGCATFFRKERFSCFKKYEVSFVLHLF